MTDRSYPEDYRTTTYRRREYPAPGDWALNVVEADGVSWHRFEGLDADHAADAPDEEPDDVVYLGLHEDVDGTPYHKFTVNGRTQARIRDDLDEDRFWQVVAECLWWVVDDDMERPDPIYYADAEDAQYTTYEEAENRRLEETAATHQTLDSFGGDSA
jgi:hypothetical protein